MLAHNIKDVLTLVPEAFNLVKEASLDKEFPVDSKSSTAASYLVANYLEKIAHKSISDAVFSLIKKAVELYELEDELNPLVNKFSLTEKQASNQAPDLKQIQHEFEDNVTGLSFFTLEKAASNAEEIVASSNGEITSDLVNRYACIGWLDKQAAVQSLTNRFIATDKTEPGYIKIARIIIDKVREDDTATIRDVCRTITNLDKQAGLDLMGFNIYKEAILTKEAAFISKLLVNVGGENFPYEKVVKFGKDRIGSLLGKDVANGLTGNPVNDKAVLESLPRDLQLVLKTGLKNV